MQKREATTTKNTPSFETMAPKKMAAVAARVANKASTSNKCTVRTSVTTPVIIDVDKTEDKPPQVVDSSPKVQGPTFVLPEEITKNKPQFFSSVFNWYCKKNAHQIAMHKEKLLIPVPSSSATNDDEITVKEGATSVHKVKREEMDAAPAGGVGSTGEQQPPPPLTIPWRLPPYHNDPYAIWVSEVMSQQTQISTVVRYWASWMKAFPTVEALAAAESEAVRAIWAGMGFYRRADFLHKGAQYIVNVYRPQKKQSEIKKDENAADTKTIDVCDNIEIEPTISTLTSPATRTSDDKLFPTRYEEWMKVPGVGPYTAAAITSLCFNSPASAVDGNVMRVFSRLCGAHNVDPKNPKHLAMLQSVLNQGLEGEKSGRTTKVKKAAATSPVSPSSPFLSDCPPEIRGRINEGLMEIGASVCRPNAAPLCHECPFAGNSTSTPYNGNNNMSSLTANSGSGVVVTFCKAFQMLKNGDIEAIDGIIPMRGTAATVRDASVETFVVFVAKGKGEDKDKGDDSEVAGGRRVRQVKEEDNREGGGRALPNGDDLGDEAHGRVARLRATVDGVSVLCVTRPKGGLLSEMTDFPSNSAVAVEGNSKGGKQPGKVKKGEKRDGAHSFKAAGEFVHVFSHIRMKMAVFAAVVDTEEKGKALLRESPCEGKQLGAEEGSSPLDECPFSVPLHSLTSYPVSQLALKSLQHALPVLWERRTSSTCTARNSGDAKILAHDLCNRRIAGQKASREKT